MHSRWVMVDALIREIGALRHQARRLDPRGLDDRVMAELDRCISDAAQAIDETIAAPEDEEGLLGACEAIVIARDHIEAAAATLGKKPTRTGERSVAQRRQASRQLYEVLKAREGRRPTVTAAE